MFATLRVSGSARAGDRNALLKFLLKGERLTLPDRKEDFNNLVEIVKYWEENPPDSIWEKYVVSIFGTTSAGKSSFVNHVLGIPLRHSFVCSIDNATSCVIIHHMCVETGDTSRHWIYNH